MEARRSGANFKSFLPEPWHYASQVVLNGVSCRTRKFQSEGVSLVKVMAIVGHSEISTTNEYLRLSGVDIKKDTAEEIKI